MEKTQFSLVLANKRGELAKLADVLAQSEVNVEALTLSDGVHTGVLKIVVDEPEATRAALKREGIRFYEQMVLAIPIPNAPGALAEMCTKLAEDGYSIDYVYGSTCGCVAGDHSDCRPLLMVSVADLKSVEELEDTGLWPGP